MRSLSTLSIPGEVGCGVCGGGGGATNDCCIECWNMNHV